MSDTPAALPAAELLARAAARWPQRDAVVFGDQRLTYAGLDRAASRLAQALIAAGLGRGHIVAMLSHNRIEYPVYHMGAARAGTLQAHLSVRYTADELAHVLAKIGAEAVFAEAALLPNLRLARPHCPALETVIVLGSPEGGFSAGEIGWDAFHAGAADTPPTVAIDPAEPFCITFTGGTTGFPKGVVASHGARSLIAMIVAEPFELTPRDTAVLCSPMFHLAGLCSWFYPAMAAGTTIVMLPKWEPGIFLAAVERERATMGFMVPTMINALLNDPGFAPGRVASLRLLNYGGSPMPLALLERVFATLPKVRMLDHYGQSECGAIAYRPPERARDKPLSNGIPFKGVEVAVLAADGAPFPSFGAENIGEIVVRGPTTAMGYHNDDGQTAATFLAGGWVKTGDVGYRDGEGYLFLVDRSKDMIIAGGENIYPAEIENALFLHPAVKECAVFGIPDAHWGEVPAAHVVLAEGQAGAVTAEALIEFVAGKIARHKRPRLVKFVDTLPKTAVGKVQKNLLRKPYWEGRGRAI